MGSKNYDHEDVRERLEQIKQKSHISEANAQLLQEFIDYTSADSDVSCKKQHEYLGTFNIFIRDYCDKDLKEADKKDIRKAVGRLNATDYADWTVRGYKVAIKKLYRTQVAASFGISVFKEIDKDIRIHIDPHKTALT